MTPLLVIGAASAHPPMAGALRPDAHERLADDVLLGPMGCFESEVTASWEHHSGGFDTAGTAHTTWRLDHRVWRLDAFEIQVADEDSLDVRIAPLLIGASVHSDLRYPTTRQRTMEWPGPVATLPARVFGEVETVAIDELLVGSKRVVQAFEWDGWKRVTGERSVTFGAEDRTEAVSASLDVTDRWPNGCRVRSAGTATLDDRGLPVTERWEFDGDCVLRGWSGVWTFVFHSWHRCTMSGPSETDPGIPL